MRHGGEIDPESHGSQGNAVLDRAFHLLWSFRAPGEELTLTVLATRAGLPKPTALRLIRQLCDWGALERSEAGVYTLGLRLLELATLAPRGHGLRAVVLPHLEDLHAVTGQHVLLAVREDDESILVERLSRPGAGRVLYRVGGRLPLHATGVGRVLLAFAPHEVQDAVLSSDLILEPERKRVDAVELRRVLAGIRKEGLAIMRRLDPEPMVSLAAPVYGQRREVIAAISVVFPQSRPLTPQLRSALLLSARAASRDLSGAVRAVHVEDARDGATSTINDNPAPAHDR